MYLINAKMKKLKPLFFLLTILMFGFASCNTENLNATTHDMLKGTWELESFLDDNEERIGNALTDATIEFISSNDTGGSSKWILNTALGTTEEFNIIYSVINSGNEINFSGDIFTLEFIGEKIKLEGNTTNSEWIIEAKKQ